MGAADGLPVLPLLPGMPAIPGVTTEAGAPAPAAPQVNNPFAGTPLEGLFPQGVPQLPGLPGSPAPAAESGAQQQNPPSDPSAPAPAAGGNGVAPAARPIAYEGDAAVTALLGRKPTSVEYLMLSSILEGGTLRVTEEAAS